jgi:hypothetical protein
VCKANGFFSIDKPPGRPGKRSIIAKPSRAAQSLLAFASLARPGGLLPAENSLSLSARVEI